MKRNPLLSSRGRIIAAALCLLLVPVGYMVSNTLAYRMLIGPTPQQRGVMLATGHAVPRVGTFSQLREGDAMIVHYHSHGCFHDAEYEFTFRRASELTVSVVKLPSAVKLAGVSTTGTDRVELGTLTLSEADISGLDRLIELYRTGDNKFCTSIEDITLTQQKDGKTDATERITYDSCQFDKMEDMTTFSSLIGRSSPPSADE